MRLRSQGGIDAARSGDTVLVSPGTYNENIDFDGKAITLTSGAKTYSDTPVAATIIRGASDGPVVTLWEAATASSHPHLRLRAQDQLPALASPLWMRGVYR